MNQRMAAVVATSLFQCAMPQVPEGEWVCSKCGVASGAVAVAPGGGTGAALRGDKGVTAGVERLGRTPSGVASERSAASGAGGAGGGRRGGRGAQAGGTRYGLLPIVIVVVVLT
jgi:hypothetical protein